MAPPASLGHKLVLHEYGETPMDALDQHLELVEQPPPDPAALGPNDVVVAVRSAQVGWVDLMMSSGQYQHMVAPPYTPGLEYSGVVHWLGERAAQRLTLGQAVLADGFRTGPRSHGAYKAHGGFASYAVAPSEALIPLPEQLSFDQGCNLLANYETAYHCLIARGGLQAGETVLIHGASGSTGLAAVHLAKLLGATVIATGRSPEKLAAVAEEGADHTILCTRTDDGSIPRFRDQVKELTEGRGVHVVYDGVGGDISLESLRCVRFGARYLIVGWAATPFVARGKGGRGAPRANQLPTNLIMMKGLDVLGCPAAISTRFDPSLRPTRLKQILAWVEEGRIQPRVGPSFALSDYKEALTAKWNSQSVGGIVIRP